MGIWRAVCGDVHARLEVARPRAGTSGLRPAVGSRAALAGSGVSTNCWCVAAWRATAGRSSRPTGKLRYPLHGKIANMPAHKVEVTIDGDSGEIAVTGVVDEARLFGNKLRLTTTITHDRSASRGMTVSRRNHQPFGRAGRVGAAVPHQFRPAAGDARGEGRVAGQEARAPRRGGRGGRARMERLRSRDAGPGRGVPLLRSGGRCGGPNAGAVASAAGNQGVSVKFNKSAIALLHALEEPPGGRRRLRNRPGAGDQLSEVRNRSRSEKGRVAQLAPGETRRFEVSIEAHTDAAAVAAAEQAIAAIQGSMTARGACQARSRLVGRMIATTVGPVGGGKHRS